MKNVQRNLETGDTINYQRNLDVTASCFRSLDLISQMAGYNNEYILTQIN